MSNLEENTGGSRTDEWGEDGEMTRGVVRISSPEPQAEQPEGKRPRGEDRTEEGCMRKRRETATGEVVEWEVARGPGCTVGDDIAMGIPTQRQLLRLERIMVTRNKHLAVVI